METADSSTSSEVMLFLDGGDLYVTGEASSIDLVLTDLLGPDDATRRRSATRLAEAGAVAASVAAMATPVEELFRLTPEGLAKLAQYGEQFTDGGALRGFVRGDAGRFAGDLSFEASLSALNRPSRCKRPQLRSRCDRLSQTSKLQSRPWTRRSPTFRRRSDPARSAKL